MRVRRSALLFTAWLAAAPAAAVEVPFLEDFSTSGDAASWRNATVQGVDWVASGGPDGGAHIATTLSYFGFENPFGGGPVVFRAQDEFGASGGAFEGDWLAAGVGEVRAFVRHDTGFELNFFLRVATSFNIPGAVFEDDVTVPSGVWTQVTWTIDPASPLCSGEGVTCEEALADVGHFQVGTDAPPGLVAIDEELALQLDRVELAAPEPAGALLAATGALALALTARARRRAAAAVPRQSTSW
jgi:hypothetical protein